jgi:hypothetical protein
MQKLYVYCFLQVVLAVTEMPQTVPEIVRFLLMIIMVVSIEINFLFMIISANVIPHLWEIRRMSSHKFCQKSPCIAIQLWKREAWLFWTVTGLFLFLVETFMVCWSKFYQFGRPSEYAWLAAIMVAVVAIIALLALIIYNTFVKSDSTDESSNKTEGIFEV